MLTLPEMQKKLQELRRCIAEGSSTYVNVTSGTTYKWLREGIDRYQDDPSRPLAARYAGLTQADGGEAVEMLDDTWQFMQQAEEVLDAVERLAHPALAVVRWFSNSILAKMNKLLCGKSIRLTDAHQAPGFLKLTGLRCGPGEVIFMTPEELIAAMLAAAEKAQSVFNQIDDLTRGLPGELLAAGKKLENIAETGRLLGFARMPELGVLQQKLAELDGNVLDDPLSVKRQLDQYVAYILKRLEARLESYRQKRDAVATSLAAANKKLAELRQAQEDSKAAYARCLQEVDDPESIYFPLEDGELSELAPWLVRLEDAFKEGGWKSTEIGLVAWNNQVQELLDFAQQVLKRNQEALTSGTDLRGLLKAMQARAADKGMQDDPELQLLGRQARNLLRERPLQVTQARKLVFEYQSKLKEKLS